MLRYQALLVSCDILQCGGFSEGEWLYGVDVVPIVTCDPRQAGL